MRVTLQEKLMWLAQAQANGLRLGDWIREQCNESCPTPEQIAKAKEIMEEIQKLAPIGSRLTIKMPQRYQPRNSDDGPSK